MSTTTVVIDGAAVSDHKTICGNATDIREQTEALLLGCHTCPVPFYVYAKDDSGKFLVDSKGKLIVSDVTYNVPPAASTGIVSSKMQCNPKGSFCYVNKVDNKCEKNSKLHLDLDLLAELPVDELCHKYFQIICHDPRFGRLFCKDEVCRILEALCALTSNLDCAGPSGCDARWPARLIRLLCKLLDRFGCSYSLPTEPDCGYTNECGDIDFAQLVACLFARFRIIACLDNKFGASSSKETQGVVKQEVNISWDFCNAPGIKGPCNSGGGCK